MQIENTALAPVKIITLNMLRDARGFFCERLNPAIALAIGVANFPQVNHSRSLPGVIRGLHFQHAPMQGKLLGVTRGAVLDVAVDVRPESAQFGKHVAVELSEENGKLLWIPPGFAHGFCVLGDMPADVVYNVTAPFAAGGEGGVQFNDAQIGISWPVQNPIISERDAALPSLADAKPQLATWFKGMA